MMKKLILILTLGILATSINAQLTFKKSEDYKTYTGVAGDTLNGSYLLTKTIYLGLKNYEYKYYIEADADSLGDGTDITCRLRGSMDGSNWTNIGDAITWGVTASDTTIVYSNLSASVSTTETVAAHTETHSGTSSVAAFNVTADTTGLSGYFADTLAYPQQTTTYTDTTTVASHAITTAQTITEGVAWRYLQVYFLGGGANADMELEAIRVRILKKE